MERMLNMETVLQLNRDHNLSANFQDMLQMLENLDTSPEFKTKMEKMFDKLWEIFLDFKFNMKSTLEMLIPLQNRSPRFLVNKQQEIIPQFREYIEIMLNNLNQEKIHGFRADMEKMFNNIDQEIFYGLRAGMEMQNQETISNNMEKIRHKLNMVTIPQIKAHMERMLNNLNQAIIPFKANMETAILNDDLNCRWKTNMTTMFNMNYLEMISQFRANMETMLRMQEQETESNSQYGDNMLSWIMALSSEFGQGYWTRLQEFVNEERSNPDDNIFPPEAEVFTWMKYCPLDQIKVVIIGQDPYHKPGRAHGLCFSVKGPVPADSSLENIFKELETDVGFVNPGHGDLTYWAEQGVLLLNAVLTVSQSGKANSHEGKGWEVFTNRVVSLISERNSGVVFLLWGAYAIKKGQDIDKKKHHILTSSHPSPLSAHKGFDGHKAFDGCNHFSETNKLLRREGKTAINWQIKIDGIN